MGLIWPNSRAAAVRLGRVRILAVMSARDIVVIGASAGGLEALPSLAASLPSDFQTAIFITIHLYGGRDNYLPFLLNRAGPLPAAHAHDGEPIKKGRIYTAPPDFHLEFDNGHMVLNHGPKENMQRPCINAMFRSAAAAYGPRVTGVLLTGMLDDGAAGLWEIHRRGGATIVQDPAEAPFPSMPESAIHGFDVQHIARLADIGPLLVKLAAEDRKRVSQPSPEPRPELSAQSCPACGGAMTAAKLGGLHEFRCHIGHRFGLKTLITEKGNQVERATDAALAQSEELTALLDLALAEASDPEEERKLQKEIAQRKEEQEALRSLAGSPMLDRVES
jgi:two-component system, chemotaxis family, protein-glutamate methylesterase/glutaminase